MTGQGYWVIFQCTWSLLVHFVIVIAFLFSGAFLFAIIEDSGEMIPDDSIVLTPEHQNGTIRNMSLDSEEHFWKHFHITYGIQMSANAREEVYQFYCNVQMKSLKSHQSHTTCKKHESAISKNRGKYFILMKWFYFATTCTTTIGYDHTPPLRDDAIARPPSRSDNIVSPLSMGEVSGRFT